MLVQIVQKLRNILFVENRIRCDSRGDILLLVLPDAERHPTLLAKTGLAVRMRRIPKPSCQLLRTPIQLNRRR